MMRIGVSLLSMMGSIGLISLNAFAQTPDDDFPVEELRELFAPPIIGGLGAGKPIIPFKMSANVAGEHGGVFGADVSHYTIDCDKQLKPDCSCSVNWADVYAQGVRYVYMKGTHGDGSSTKPDYSRAIFWEQLKSFHEKGMMYRGAYHWLTSGDGQSGKQQAKHFIDNVPMSDPQLPPIVDFEEDFVYRSREYYDANPNTCEQKLKKGVVKYVCDGWVDVDKAERLKRLTEWLEDVEKVSKVRPAIYTRTKYWKNMLGADRSALEKKYSFWLAQYPAPPKWRSQTEASPWKMLEAPVPYPPAGPGKAYSSGTHWQFADTQRGRFEKAVVMCDGKAVDTSTDLNWFPSNTSDFEKYLVGK